MAVKIILNKVIRLILACINIVIIYPCITAFKNPLNFLRNASQNIMLFPRPFLYFLWKSINRALYGSKSRKGLLAGVKNLDKDIISVLVRKLYDYKSRHSRQLKRLFRLAQRLFYCSSVILTIYFLESHLEREGHFMNLKARSFDKEFYYPVNGNISELAHTLEAGRQPWLDPVFNHHYNIVQDPSHRCHHFYNTKLIYLVQSYTENDKHREMIRNTWGHENMHPEVKIFFFLGVSVKDVHVQRYIDNEFILYQDIVQGDFSDHDDSLKLAMTLKWASLSCNSSTAFVLADDSTFLSTKKLLDVVDGSISQINKDNKFWSGSVQERPAPVRKRSLRDKFVSLDEYPYDYFPPLLDSVSMMSRSTLLDFYYGSYFTEYFRLPEAWLAIIAYKMKIEPEHNNKFMQNYPKNQDELDSALSFSKLNLQDIYYIWKHYKKNKFNITDLLKKQ